MPDTFSSHDDQHTLTLVELGGNPRTAQRTLSDRKNRDFPLAKLARQWRCAALARKLGMRPLPAHSETLFYGTTTTVPNGRKWSSKARRIPSRSITTRLTQSVKLRHKGRKPSTCINKDHTSP